MKKMRNVEKRPGRPRGFTEEDALESAQQAFIEKGYEGCSVDDLTCALGINKPSLYSAFGNKEELFLKVLTTYHDKYKKQFEELTGKGMPPKETISEWFSWFLDNYRRQDSPVGCLIVNSTLLAGENYPKIAEQLKVLHDLNEKLMADYLRSEKKKGRFNGDPKAVSQFLNAVVQGMAVLHRSQRNRPALKNIVVQALAAFPD